MNVKVILFVVLCFVFTTNADQGEELYYWREYKGRTPEDAYVVGNQQNAKPMYFGQVLYQNKIEAGKINHNTKAIYITPDRWGTIINDRIKILCTDNTTAFRWISIYKHHPIGEVSEKYKLLAVESEPGRTVYLGRAWTKADGYRAGQVICEHPDWGCNNLYTAEPYFIFKFEEFENYEVLGFIRNLTSQTATETVTRTTTIAPLHRTCFANYGFPLTIIPILIVVVVILLRHQFKFVRGNLCI